MRLYLGLGLEAILTIFILDPYLNSRPVERVLLFTIT